MRVTNRRIGEGYYRRIGEGLLMGKLLVATPPKKRPLPRQLLIINIASGTLLLHAPLHEPSRSCAKSPPVQST